jgi:outer membrane murein-binding lipoprotein Lpp
MEISPMRKFLFPVVILAPLAIAACSSGESSTTTTSVQDMQARQTAQQALQTAQQAQATANDAKQEADRMNQRNLQK